MLYPYGIEDEQSDIRAHVSVVGRCVYIFRTAAARQVISEAQYPNRPVTVDGQLRATGWLVPPGDIPGCQAVPIPPDLFERAGFSETDNTTQRGSKAEYIVTEMTTRGLLPYPAEVYPVNRRRDQISGADLLINVRPTRVQVKLDWNAGPRGTGNLFIQESESNPLGLH